MSKEIVKIESDLKYNEKQTTDSTSVRDSNGSASESGTQVSTDHSEAVTTRNLTGTSTTRKTMGAKVNIGAQVTFTVKNRTKQPVNPDTPNATC